MKVTAFSLHFPRYLLLVPTLFCVLHKAISSPLQADDKNVVIKTASERYAFVLGKGESPVLINKDLEVTFRCDGYRTSFPFVEFYNDQSVVNDVSVYVSGKKAKNIQPVREYYSSQGIFYSDARICYVQVPLEKKNAESTVKIAKTYLDPRYFTSVYFSDVFAIENKEIILEVPDWVHLEIKEMNFDGYHIRSDKRRDGNKTIYRYTVANLPPRISESESRGPSYIYPHLLILTQYAEAGGKQVTYFRSTKDQYAWYKHLVDQVKNDREAIKSKAEEITRGKQGDLPKVMAILSYVQNNIRYIAFEDGIAGFKPEAAQEVLRKNYGDCKGMANLTRELLLAAGFDARMCWIGTNYIAYDYSTPSLAVDNHMICALRLNGAFHFLDATQTYIGFDQYAERIQGRQVLIEDGENFILDKIPQRLPDQNISTEKRTLRLEGTTVSGKVAHRLTGESKEWLLSKIHSLKKDKLSTALQLYLSSGQQRCQISELKTSDLTERNNDLDISYHLEESNAASSFGDELYLEMDFRKEMEDNLIDLEKRKLDILFPYKDSVVYETVLTIPKEYKVVHLPENLTVSEPGYSFSVNYRSEADKIFYQKQIVIRDTHLKKNDFKQWNLDIQKLKKSYGEQVTLSKK